MYFISFLHHFHVESLRLPPLYVDRAYRLYQLAIQKNLIMRRRQSNMVAACLYSICRQEKSPHLLIDFSDSLQINVFVLGKAFMQFSSVLNLKLPIVDPSLYIHRSFFSVYNTSLGCLLMKYNICADMRRGWILGRS